MAAPSFASRYGASINWFPGHMAKTSRLLAEHGKKCDVIVEVRDARVPFSSGNPMMDGLTSGTGGALSGKPRLLVLNKADLANEALQPRVAAILHSQGYQTVFMSADPRRGRTDRGLRKLLSLIDAIPARHAGFRAVGALMLVVGIPNVGKSSLINAVRTFNKVHDTGRASVAPTPGHTRQVSALKVRHTPPLYLYDTPGVLMPRIPDVEVGVRLAVTTAIREAAVPAIVQAEYLLYYFAIVGSERYVTSLGLSRAYSEDEVEECLADLAARLGCKKAGGEYDLDTAARYFVRAFQEGDLGRYTLDYVSPQECAEGGAGPVHTRVQSEGC